MNLFQECHVAIGMFHDSERYYDVEAFGREWQSCRITYTKLAAKFSQILPSNVLTHICSEDLYVFAKRCQQCSSVAKTAAKIQHIGLWWNSSFKILYLRYVSQPIQIARDMKSEVRVNLCMPLHYLPDFVDRLLVLANPLSFQISQVHLSLASSTGLRILSHFPPHQAPASPHRQTFFYPISSQSFNFSIRSAGDDCIISYQIKEFFPFSSDQFHPT
jgi:hypothetical protein